MPLDTSPGQLAALDLHAAGHRRAERGERHEVAHRHVERATADLERLAVAGVDRDQLDLVGVGCGRVRGPGHDDAVEALADAVELLDGHAEVAHRLTDRDRAPSNGANSRSQDSRTFI